MRLFLFLLFAFSNCLNAQDIQEWLSIAIVRNDGIIVPVARHLNGKWEKIYNQPKSLRPYEDLVPTWYLQNNIDGSSADLRKGHPVNFDYNNESMIGWGYLSAYRFDLFKTPIIFRSIVGIATNLDIPQLTVSRLTSRDPRWRTLELTVKTTMRDNAIQLSEVIATKLDSTTLYYIEAGKTISPKEPCPTHFIAIQWIAAYKNAFTTIYQDSTTDDCDFKLESGIHVVPYGGFQFGNKNYFIVSAGGWDSADYRLVSISMNGIVDIIGDNRQQFCCLTGR